MVDATSQRPGLRSVLGREAVAGAAWFAVIDAAQDDTARGLARSSGLRMQSLYAGELGARLDHVAPHLSTFALEGQFADWLFTRWDGNHGILLQSTAAFDKVRRHLRKFLLVKDEGGKKYRFRFYDPRVLRSFLPSCAPAEAREFFGPVAKYYAAGRSGQSVLTFEWRRERLTMRDHPFSLPAGDGGRGAAAAEETSPSWPWLTGGTVSPSSEPACRYRAP